MTLMWNVHNVGWSAYMCNHTSNKPLAITESPICNICITEVLESHQGFVPALSIADMIKSVDHGIIHSSELSQTAQLRLALPGSWWGRVKWPKDSRPTSLACILKECTCLTMAAKFSLNALFAPCVLALFCRSNNSWFAIFTHIIREFAVLITPWIISTIIAMVHFSQVYSLV